VRGRNETRTNIFEHYFLAIFLSMCTVGSSPNLQNLLLCSERRFIMSIFDRRNIIILSIGMFILLAFFPQNSIK
jgi:hypothetical protein